MIDRLLSRVLLSAAIVVPAAPARASVENVDLRGAWKSETYTLKDGTRHVMPGLLIFTKSDWTTLWLITVDGAPQRGAGEGGTYTVEGGRLTFTHLYNVSGGNGVTGMPASPLRLEVHEPGASAPREPCTVEVNGDTLVIHFPSGNRISFSRSSTF